MLSAVIEYKMDDGHLMRLCQRCTLKVTEIGKPDPWFYTGKELANFEKIPPHERRLHERQVGRKNVINVVQKRDNLYWTLNILDVAEGPDGIMVICQ